MATNCHPEIPTQFDLHIYERSTFVGQKPHLTPLYRAEPPGASPPTVYFKSTFVVPEIRPINYHTHSIRRTDMDLLAREGHVNLGNNDNTIGKFRDNGRLGHKPEVNRINKNSGGPSNPTTSVTSTPPAATSTPPAATSTSLSAGVSASSPAEASASPPAGTSASRSIACLNFLGF